MIFHSNKPKRSAGGSLKGLGAMIFIVAGLLFFAGEARQAHAAILYSQVDDSSGEIAGQVSGIFEGVAVGSFTPSASVVASSLSTSTFYARWKRSSFLYGYSTFTISSSTSCDTWQSADRAAYINPSSEYPPSSYTDYYGYIVFEAHSTQFNAGHEYTICLNNSSFPSGYPIVASDFSETSFYGYLTTDGTPPPVSDTSTRIIDFTPSEGDLLTGPNIGFTLDGYVNPADIVDDDTITIQFRVFNIDQNVLLASALSPGSFQVFQHTATTSGFFSLAATSSLADGNYRVEACLRDSRLFFGIIPNPFAGGEECQSHQFIVGQATFIGNISQQSYAQIQAIFASSTATSTAALARSCNLLGDFDMSSCIAYLFIPDAGLVRDSLINLRDNALRNFPVGYITDFAFILATTSTSSLTVVDVTLPAALAGAGASVHLDLSHVLDPILNATTSSFIGESAPDDRTFYEITSFYWEIFVVVGLLFYILRRVVGTHVFGHGHPFQEMSGDEHVSDEAYRLKERLYEMSQRK